jgi:hypothetical protein
MPDFNVRADSVNVEQIMDQIRARIREKRGVDYTEQQIRELAAVKLERFLDPKGVRSDLLEQFRKVQPPYEPPELPNFAFEDATLYESHRGIVRFFRRLFNPLLKLLFNPNPLIQALHIQAELNTIIAERDARREAARSASDALFYELIHNLVIETTRLGIEVKNLKMRVESFGSRLEFSERRGRALESAVAYKTGGEQEEAIEISGGRQSQSQPLTQPQAQVPSRSQAQFQAPSPSVQGQGSSQPQPAGEGPGQRSRRRRRRRGRRGRGPVAPLMAGQSPEQSQQAQAQPQTQPQPQAPETPSTATPREDLQTLSGAEAHRSELDPPGEG